MTLRIGLLSDPIETLKPEQDTSLLMMREAQKRGYELYYFTPTKVFLEDGITQAQSRKFTLTDDNDNFYICEDEQILDLSTLDVILMRQNPPVDFTYLTGTYILDNIRDHVLIINDPSSIRNKHGKIFTSEFEEYLVPYIIANDFAVVERFYKKHNDIILKPLRGYGGQGIVHVKPNCSDLKSEFDAFYKMNPEPFTAQAFIPEAAEGDKRITFFDGEPVSAILRVPNSADELANITAGASVVKTDITEHERKLCDKMGPVLRELGLFFVGVDFLGPYLTEINVVSPGTIMDTNKLYNIELQKTFWDKIENKLKN